MKRPVLLAVGILAGAIAVRTLTAAASPPPQLPQVPGAFRTSITLVPIDVRVLDQKGRPVTDLTRDDFVILEDGRPQEIRHFSQHTLVAVEPEPGARPPLRKPPGPELAPQAHRTFLIVLGRGRLQEPSKGFDGLLRFVREQLLPQDQVAVLAHNRATDFTTDHGKVAQVLERFKAANLEIEAAIDQKFAPWADGSPALAAIYGSKGPPPAAQVKIDTVFAAPGSVPSRQLVPGGVTDATRLARDNRRAEDALQAAAARADQQEAARQLGLPAPVSLVGEMEDLQYQAITDLDFGQFTDTNARTGSDLENIYAGIQYMRFLEGEKHLVFVSERGLFLPRLEDDKSLAAMANDARVVVDTIQTGGIPSPPVRMSAAIGGPPPPLPQPGPRFSETAALTSMKHISELTGGVASTYAYADRALARIDTVTRAGYLLGYYSSDSAGDGRYRRIEVKVKRPGLTVLSRRGYYDQQQLVPYDRHAFTAYSRIVAAGRYDREIRDIPITLEAAFIKGERPAAGEVTIALRIEAARVTLVEDEGRRAGRLDITIFCADGGEQLVGESWQTVDLWVLPETYQRFIWFGIPFTARVPVDALPRYVKVVVYDPGADLVGSAVVRLR